MISRNRLLIQVVPQLKPARCGVSDQAVLLAQELEAAFGIKSAFVILNSDEACELPYPMIHCTPAKLLEACQSLSGDAPAALLVHSSGYGYAADGAPTLLAAALEEVREDERFRVAVYFHELYASSMPWKSAFWYSRRQRKSVRRIAEASELLVTSARRYKDLLKSEIVRRSDISVKLLPVFSAIGEAHAPTSVAQRQPCLIIFGLAGSRQRAYKELSSLRELLCGLGVEEILDVGPEFDAPKDLNGISVRRLGLLPAGDLAQRFSKSMFGFLSYRSLLLAKSSIFAAYCAQGTIPVIAEPFEGEADGLKDGFHLLSPETVLTAKASGFEDCSMAAWHWYLGHRLHVHAATYARWLDSPETRVGEAIPIPVELEGQ
jgi:hypothetical protein